MQLINLHHNASSHKGLSWQRSTQQPLLIAFISSIFEVIYCFIGQCFNQHFHMICFSKAFTGPGIISYHVEWLLEERLEVLCFPLRMIYLIRDIRPRCNFLIGKGLINMNNVLHGKVEKKSREKKSN